MPRWLSPPRLADRQRDRPRQGRARLAADRRGPISRAGNRLGPQLSRRPRFLDQARAQASRRALKVEDGWTYFLHGWLQVIAEVFHIHIPVRGPEFEALSEIAEVARKG